MNKRTFASTLTPIGVQRSASHKNAGARGISVSGYSGPYLNLLIATLACCSEARFTNTVTLKLDRKFLCHKAEARNSCKLVLSVQAGPVIPLDPAGARM
jgi:hypothetical protein